MHTEGYSSWFVCLSVCLSTLFLALHSMRWPFSDASLKNKRVIFLNDVRVICCENKRKVCIIALGLSRPDVLALCTLGAQEVATMGVYRLLHAIY